MDQEPRPENQNIAAEPQPPVTNQPAKKVPKGLLIFIVIGVLAVAGVAFGYWQYQQQTKNQAAKNNPSIPIGLTKNPYGQLDTSQPAQPTSSPYANVNPTTTPPVIAATGICKNPGPVLASKSGMMQWQNAQDIEGLKIFAQGSADDGAYVDDSSQVVGHFVSGAYQGADLIVTELDPSYDEPGGNLPSFYHMVRVANSYIMLDKYSDQQPDPAEIKTVVNLSHDKNFILPDLNMPGNLHSTNPAADFSLASANAFTPHWQSFCADSMVKAFTDPVVGDVYTDQFATSPNNGTLDYGFYAKVPDGSLATYALVLDIVGQGGVPMVTWNNGQKNTTQYSYTDRTGCGSYNYASVVPADKINFNSDLAQTGTAINNEPVYEFKNSNNLILKDIYDNQYYPADGNDKMPYAQFVASHPEFFWKDSFGRLIKFQKSDFMPMAECGKPVIYLYPQKTEKISVQINPVGGFLKSEPAYNQGWNVISDPLSNITNLADGQNYPYLFWEGRGGYYKTPDRGFVVAQANIHEFLTDKLHQLGLNGKESADFVAFWEPKMQGSPYYFVTFMGNNIMDGIAPLTITPKPDTVIRILMDFKPLQQPMAVEGYNIRTPVRKGFTVVEWGGVLR